VSEARKHLGISTATLAALLLLAASAAGSHREGHMRSFAAHALTATDTAHLSYMSASGSLLFEQGRATGTLPGAMKAHFNVGATMQGSFTIYAKGGSISGRGSADLHGSGVYESFAGTLVVTGGKGRFAHAHGRAKLYGTFNRNSYALLVQTVGTLRY
jgi:hypothetical protein